MNKIKEILKAQGRSQAWLAEQIGRSYVVTTNYCNNKTQPSLFILKKIAKALDVDIRDLLSQTKDRVLSLIMRNSGRKGNVSSTHNRQPSVLKTDRNRKSSKKNRGSLRTTKTGGRRLKAS